MRTTWTVVLALMLTEAVRAQHPTEFPSDSVPITAKSFEENVAGKVFKGIIANGGPWWMDIKKDGNYFWSYPGYGDFGKWRVEGDKFCTDMETTRSTCNEVHIKDNLIFYKRQSNGEVVTLVRQPGGPTVTGKWSMTYSGPSTGRPMEAKVDIDGHEGTWQLLDIFSVANRAPCIGPAFPITVVGFNQEELAIRVEANKLMKGCGIMSFILKRVDNNMYEGIGFEDNRKVSLVRR